MNTTNEEWVTCKKCGDEVKAKYTTKNKLCLQCIEEQKIRIPEE